LIQLVVWQIMLPWDYKYRDIGPSIENIDNSCKKPSRPTSSTMTNISRH